jgi:hypothetical protein
MKQIYALMNTLYEKLPFTASLCGSETCQLLKQRWKRLIQSFYNAHTEKFDTTKVPDIFDYVLYDVIHNQKALSE